MPVKVEPKTMFANERTLIQWLSAALLLVTLSTALMGIGNTEGTKHWNALDAALRS